MNPAFGIGVQDTPYSRYYFAHQSEPIKKQFYGSRVVSANGQAYMNMTYGMEQLRQGMFAFHTSTGAAYVHMGKTFTANEKCGLIVIKFFDMGHSWHVFQKRSPFKEIFKVK